jgi:hypothetical protein
MTSHVLHQQNITTREKMTTGELERSGQLTIANSLVQDISERPKKRMQISTFATCQDLVFKIEPIKEATRKEGQVGCLEGVRCMQVTRHIIKTLIKMPILVSLQRTSSQPYIQMRISSVLECQ